MFTKSLFEQFFDDEQAGSLKIYILCKIEVIKRYLRMLVFC